MRWMLHRLLPLIVISCLLTSCWDRVELNDRAVILGWGMDKEKDGQYLASAMIFIPQSNNNNSDGNLASLSKHFEVFTGKGRSIMEAANQIQPKLSRTIFAGNRRMIVIGESMARDGLSNILDEYSRNKDVRLRTDMVIVEKGTALSLLEMVYPLEDSPATGALKIHENTGGLADKAMVYFLQAINDPGKSPTLPQLSLSSKEQSHKQEMQMTGIAVFDNNLKMKYKLNVDETHSFFWLTKKINKFSITVPIKEKGVINVDMHRLSSKIAVKLVDGKPQFEVKLKGDVMIVENETALHLDQMEDFRKVKEALNLKCKTDMEAFLHHIQQEKTDVVGFNGYIHRKYPRTWRKMEPTWGVDFAHTSIKVQANMTLRQIGLTGTSIENEEDPD
ncbi:Ger(x)C family spore germination protein [Paenibacillus sp. NPDC056722]|uniref:Ger(x)C family spore germination protein n=1 Tax=Paenibacillus sp. NPDC056722 TaxID=3345924 RepID=UPI0036893E85